MLPEKKFLSNDSPSTRKACLISGLNPESSLCALRAALAYIAAGDASNV